LPFRRCTGSWVRVGFSEVQGGFRSTRRFQKYKDMTVAVSERLLQGKDNDNMYINSKNASSSEEKGRRGWEFRVREG
jgi:hypothetical protein